MTDTKKPDIRKYSNFLVFSISLIPLILFLYIVWNRLSLPFVFEWGESAGVNQINRILTGSNLYGPPTLDFSPLVYTPLYYYLAAGLSLLLDNSLLAARIISVLCTIGIVFLIIRMIKNETRNTLLAWISGMLYLACFALSDGFYDLARVDSLYVFLVLIAFSVVLEAKNLTEYILYGTLLVIGFFVKQSFLLIFFPLQAYLIFKRVKLSWAAIAVAIVGIGSLLFYFNSAANDWFFYYIFELPKEHGYSLISAINFWIGDTIRPLGIIFVFGLIFLLKTKLFPKEMPPGSSSGLLDAKDSGLEGSNHRWWLFVLFLAGAAGTAWITRSSNGGGVNNCMVIYAVMAISFGLGAGLLFKSRVVKEHKWIYVFIMLVISFQFIGLIYNPFNFLPTEDEVQANRYIAEKIRDADSQVLIPYRSHLTGELGASSQIHMVNLFELTGYFKGDILPSGFKLIDQIREEICKQSYGLIFLDQPVPWMEKQMDEAYRLELNFIDTNYQQSDLLEWQQGNWRSYLPKEDYDLERCLSGIPAGRD